MQQIGGGNRISDSFIKYILYYKHSIIFKWRKVLVEIFYLIQKGYFPISLLDNESKIAKKNSYQATTNSINGGFCTIAEM